MAGFEYVFPSIRGIQAGREYYISMCPLRLIPRIFLFDEEELRPELRSQRTLNKQRVPDMCRYILENTNEYIFSALTASIDGKVRFEPIGEAGDDRSMGRLWIPMNAKFVINDGQHRRAAIEAALHENPELGDETISVVFFMDVGLKRTQQMFADLNRYAVRPTTSIGILYDHRAACCPCLRSANSDASTPPKSVMVTIRFWLSTSFTQPGKPRWRMCCRCFSR